MSKDIRPTTSEATKWLSKNKTKQKHKFGIIVSSDSETEPVRQSPKKTVIKSRPTKLKQIDIRDIYIKTPMKQTSQEIVTVASSDSETESVRKSQKTNFKETSQKTTPEAIKWLSKNNTKLKPKPVKKQNQDILIIVSSDSETESALKSQKENLKETSQKTTTPKATKWLSKNKTKLKPKPVKKQECQKLTIVSSDSETESALKPQKKIFKESSQKTTKEATKWLSKNKTKLKPKPVKKKNLEIVVVSFDSETEPVRQSLKKTFIKNDLTKLKQVDLEELYNVFKKTPINNGKVEIEPKTPTIDTPDNRTKIKNKSIKEKGKNKEQSVHNGRHFEKTLQELEFVKLLDESLAFEHNPSKADSNLEDLDDDMFVKAVEPLDESLALEHNPSKAHGDPDNQLKNERKRCRADSSSEKIPKKRKIEHSGIDPGQETHEKKRYSAMLYQKYLNRSGPKHRGLKEYQKGKHDCLKNLCFLKTGVLDSFESEDFENLVKPHGGRVVHAVSKKVNYIVVGDDAGPAKLAKAGSYNIPQISENELLNMILKNSGMETKFSKKNILGSNSDDLGIEPDTEKKNIKETQADQIQDGTTKPAGRTQAKFDNMQTKSSSTKVDAAKNISPPKEPSPQLVSTSKSDDSISIPLTEKYKPQNRSAIIGLQGEGGNLYKLKNWLQNWYKNRNPKRKLVRPSRWAQIDNGAYFKCALLSGPPGVGKTMSTTLVAKELGLDLVEFNASDTRSKMLLGEEVAQSLSNNAIAGYATGQDHVTKNRVLLMDEVDGMAGNEDRGGIQELIQLIHNSNIPIICICNDLYHQKMRSLVNYCYNLKFTKPRLRQIVGAMMSICFKEDIKISPTALTEIIRGTGLDIRQTLNQLSFLAAKQQDITPEMAERHAKSSKKDIVMRPWEVCRSVFTKSDHKDMSLDDKERLFFFDYSLGLLFVQENYLKVQPEGNCSKKQTLLKATFAADAISMGDLIDSKIRRTNNWSLVESQAFFLSVIPGHYMAGDFRSQINFPGWLGKNSKKNKFNRLFNKLQIHTRTSASGGKLAVKLDYLVPLRNAIISPLKNEGMEGVDEAVAVMKSYNLLREDVNSLLELCQWTGGENPVSKVETKVQNALTRSYNKQVTLLPYASASKISTKRAAVLESDALEEEVLSENEDEDDINNNALIKVKIKKKPAAKREKTEEATTRQKTDTKKRKGKKSK